MKGMSKRIYKKRLECLVWACIIALFFTMYHRKIADAGSIHVGNGDSTLVTLSQNTEDRPRGSFIQDTGQCNSEVFAYDRQSGESSQSGATRRGRRFIARESQEITEDIYEQRGDNQPESAWPIVVNNPGQEHTFHTYTDIDWVYFFGHEGYEYDMKAYVIEECNLAECDLFECNPFITLSLADPNGEILTNGELPIQDLYCYLHWECPKDGYYFLKIELTSKYPGGETIYTLSVEDDHKATLTGYTRGRVINSKGEGVNGVRVNIVSSGEIIEETKTGSIEGVLNNTLNQSMIDGWYYFLFIPYGVYEIIVTEDDPNIIVPGDDPNIILKRITNVHIAEFDVNKIEDIVLDLPSSEFDAVSSCEIAYTQYQNKKQDNYPVSEDKDGEGATNLEEFQFGTDPDNPQEMPWQIKLPGGWSMVSIPLIPDPLKPQSASVSKLFPGAQVVYAYEKGLGYKRVKETDELKEGRGYWVLLKEKKTCSLTGKPVHYHTLSVKEDGWAMIGGCTYEARVSADSCHIGAIYGYDQETGYHQVAGSVHPEPGDDPEHGEFPESREDTELGEYPEPGDDSDHGEDTKSVKNPEHEEFLVPERGYWILLNGISGQCKLTVETN